MKENIFQGIKNLSADDIAIIICDNYGFLLENLDEIPLFVKDVICINELQLLYQDEGSLLYSDGFSRMEDARSAMERIGSSDEAEILSEMLEVIGDKLKAASKSGASVLSDEECGKINSLCGKMYYDDEQKYDVFWQRVSDYIDKQKLDF